MSFLEQMKLRRATYAFVLMAIYLMATVSSSASILLCSHHHHHHHAEEHGALHEEHSATCSCEGLSFEAECCDHHHALLGENHTDYIASSLRYDSRSAERDLLVLQPAVISVVVSGLLEITPVDIIPPLGDEFWPLVAAFISRESLRAPPALA